MRIADDLTLLEQYRRDGDRAAMGQLLARHSDRLYTVALRVLNNQADAQDVAQDVCVKALSAAAHFRGGNEEVGRWLLKIAFNMALNKKQREQSGSRIARQAGAEAGRLRADAALQEAVAVLEEAVAGLDPALQAPVILHFYQGMDQAAVGGFLGVSRRVVNHRLQQAGQKIREYFAGHGYTAALPFVPAALQAASLAQTPAALAGKTAALAHSAQAGAVSATTAANWTAMTAYGGATIMKLKTVAVMVAVVAFSVFTAGYTVSQMQWPQAAPQELELAALQQELAGLKDELGALRARAASAGGNGAGSSGLSERMDRMEQQVALLGERTRELPTVEELKQKEKDVIEGYLKRLHESERAAAKSWVDKLVLEGDAVVDYVAAALQADGHVKWQDGGALTGDMFMTYPNEAVALLDVLRRIGTDEIIHPVCRYMTQENDPEVVRFFYTLFDDSRNEQIKSVMAEITMRVLRTYDMSLPEENYLPAVCYASRLSDRAAEVYPMLKAILLAQREGVASIWLLNALLPSMYELRPQHTFETVADLCNDPAANCWDACYDFFLQHATVEQYLGFLELFLGNQNLPVSDRYGAISPVHSMDYFLQKNLAGRSAYDRLISLVEAFQASVAPEERQDLDWQLDELRLARDQAK